jgi:hypothetical protein
MPAGKLLVGKLSLPPHPVSANAPSVMADASRPERLDSMLFFFKVCLQLILDVR